MTDRNGHLSESELAAVPGGKLRRDAAAAFNAMNEESRRRYGVTLASEGPLGTYRTVADQQHLWDLYQQHRGNLAARPGTSNHGLGLAIDLATERMRGIVDEIGAPYGWAKRWSDAPTEWWHLKYRPGVWAGHQQAPAHSEHHAAGHHAAGHHAERVPAHAGHHGAAGTHHAAAPAHAGGPAHSATHVHPHPPAHEPRVVSRTEATAIVQQLLRAHGYGAVPVDGLAGAATVTALRQFQVAHGLGATGHLDTQTVTALRRSAAHGRVGPARRLRPALHPPAPHAGARPHPSAPSHQRSTHPHGRTPSRGPVHPHSHAGLTPEQQRAARKVIVAGCEWMLGHAAEVHYTEGPQRWSALAQRLRISERRFLTYGDCSSTATWLLWNGLTHVVPGIGDIVNGENWTGGFTGTIARHGQLIPADHAIKVGDLCLYGAPPSYEHVTVALGGGLCFSHGSEAGPFKLHLDYRPDRGPTRRFL